MKLWIDLCTLCLSLGRVQENKKEITGVLNMDFGKAGKNKADLNPVSFGSFSVRPVSAAAKKILTFCTDQNMVFKFEECWSAYSDLNALKAVWKRNFTTKGTKT